MKPWDLWKKRFDVWEASTAQHLETVLRSPVVLRPTGVILAAVMKAKTQADKVSEKWWATMGLPTKKEQERALHKMNQLESRLMDLEETLGKKAGE